MGAEIIGALRTFCQRPTEKQSLEIGPPLRARVTHTACFYNARNWVVCRQAAFGTERQQAAGPLPVSAQGGANVRYWVECSSWATPQLGALQSSRSLDLPIYRQRLRKHRRQKTG